MTLCVSLFGSEIFSAPVPKWEKILATLNQDPKSSGAFIVDIGTDLSKKYDAELSAITTEWKVNGDKSGDVKVLRAKQNKFFHDRIEELNAPTIAALEKSAVPATDRRAIAEKVLATIAASPVAKVENVMTYDRTGQVGFCFGRAMYVHYLLLQAGVKPEEVARIFVLGDLRVGELMWKFHTAILVRDPRDGYLVVDPLQPKPMGYRDWMKANAALEIKEPNSRARFYVTDPRKFLPAYGKYDLAQLNDPLLKKYFDSLRREMK